MLSQEVNGYNVPDSDHIVRGGILGDEMGLGKTIQALSLIMNGAGKNTLIITPLAVRKQWEDAACKCKVNVYTAEKPGWIKKRIFSKDGKSIYLGHYDKLVFNIGLFQEKKWDRIILDEAHRMRNTKTVTGQCVLKLKAKYKWALTATPVVNTLDDVVAYLKFIGFKLGTNTWSPAFQTYIRNVYMARTLQEGEAPAGLSMPPEPMMETRLLQFSSPEEEDVYKAILNNIEGQWRSAKALSGREYQLQKFAILLRLRQVSVNPQIYIKARQKELLGWEGPVFATPSRKFDEIAHLTRESYEEGQANRWIIFCQFHDEMELLREFLESLPHIGSVLQYHGGMNMAERDNAIKQSKILSENGLQDIFLIQLQAGGTGLNLQHYDRIIFTSPWWTSALLEQAKGRAVRLGQKNVVKVYWLKLKEEENRFSIDQFMMNKADSKKELADTFLSWSYTRNFPDAKSNTQPEWTHQE